MGKRKRKTRHEKVVDILNSQAIQNIPYTLAHFFSVPETSMAAMILAIELMKPKIPTFPEKRFEGEVGSEKEMHEYEQEINEISNSASIGKQSVIGTILPQIRTMSPIPDFSQMDIFTATQIALLFGIVLKNIPKVEAGVL